MSCLYAMAYQSGGPVKFGVSRDPWKRMKQLQTGRAETLFIIGFKDWNTRDEWGELVTWNSAEDMEVAKTSEKLLHNHFKKNQITEGGEWFSMNCGTADIIIQAFPLIWDNLTWGAEQLVAANDPQSSNLMNVVDLAEVALLADEIDIEIYQRFMEPNDAHTWREWSEQPW